MPTSKNGVGRGLRFCHLTIFEQDTFIEITPRRGRCLNCDNISSTNEKIDWYDEKSIFTKAFEHRMLFDLVNSPVADVNRKSGFDYHTVDNLIDRYIKKEVSPLKNCAK